jgi:hypothetical protein
MLLVLVLAWGCVVLGKPTFQDEIRARANSKPSPAAFAPGPPGTTPGSPGPFEIPSDDASLRQRAAQAYGDVARYLHGDGDGTSMTGADLPAVLAAILNPGLTALSADEEAEVAKLTVRWAARAGFGGEEGSQKPLPLQILQQHAALSFLREAAPILARTTRARRAAARAAAEAELAAGEEAAAGAARPDGAEAR